MRAVWPRINRQACAGVLAAALALAGGVARAQSPELKAAWSAVYHAVDTHRLQSAIATLSSSKSRVAGYPGDAEAAKYVERQFTQIGLEGVRHESFPVAVPVDKGTAAITVRPPGAAAFHLPLYPLWPNLVCTSELPAGGLSGPIIYVGGGALTGFNGKDVEGSIVLVDFNSRAEWLNAPRLGARAVIFLAPDSTMRGEAEAKFISIPISIPRFWLRRSDSGPLLAATATGGTVPCSLTCDMPWERHVCANIFGYIPGTDPVLRQQVVVVEAYYDSISVVPGLAPGAESACGISAMLELARIYRAHPPARTVWFIATSAHFQALQGIREYLHAHMNEWMSPGYLQVATSSGHATVTVVILLLVTLFALTSSTLQWRARAQSTRRAGIKRWSTFAATVMAALLSLGLAVSPHAELPTPPKIFLWAGLDLSSQSRAVGIFYKGWFYDGREDNQGKFSDIARVCRENAEKIGNTIGFDHTRVFADGVNAVDGKNWRNYIPGKPAFDSEAVTMAQGMGITFASTDDSRALVDTPYDTVDRVNLANITFQTRLLACEFYDVLNDTNAPGDITAQRMPFVDSSRWSRMALQGGFATLKGRVAMFNPRKAFMAYPDARLSGALVVLHGKEKSYMGVRGNMVQMLQTGPDSAEANGFAFHGVAPLTATTGNAPTHVAAYNIAATGPHRGEIDYAPDMGDTGARWIPLDVMVTTATKEVPIILFRCVPTAIYDLVDQQSLKALTTIDVLDGVSDGEPRMYGYAIDPKDPNMAGSYVEDVAVIFSIPGTRLKILMGGGPGDVHLLLINPTREHPEGEGYLVSGDPKDNPIGDAFVSESIGNYDPAREIARSGAIYNTALHVSQDMWTLDEYRIKRLARFRIINEGINDLHSLAAGAITQAKQAAGAKDWDRFYYESRAAWGFESRAYPDVQHTAVDVIQGVLFYLALLLPFAYFMERLLFGSYDLRRQLGYASLIFLGVFLVFSQVHPAFSITMSPAIVFLGFVMLALSVIVMALVAGKFEDLLKQLNRQISGIHKADVGRMSVAIAAFNLGISNMRRRKARTLLTSLSLILITFVVLSFTSIVQTMHFNQVAAPGLPRYSGLMIRTAMWDKLQDPAYRLLKDEYGQTGAVAPRAWFFGTQAGDQSFLTVTRGNQKFDARAMVGLAPDESLVTRPQDALVSGRWFRPGDVNSIILPDSMASVLGMDPRDAGKATVTYAGVEYLVIGVLDNNRLKNITDLDSEIVTPVDFIQMQKSTSQGGGGSNSTGFRDYTHLEPDSVFYLPYETATDLGAELRSIAIAFPNPDQVLQTLRPLMHRLDLNLYAGRIPAHGKPIIQRFSSISATSGKGMELVLLPVILAALSVLNTMLGSVYERVKEIHIFSSIGLAPSHIGMLFIAEAMVYAILGSVAGYVLAQITIKVLVATGAFQGLYLNFSSVSAVLTTLIVVAVVLLSTLYPARKAAEVASPAIDRTWRVPDPDGDTWSIPLPFAVTGEQASGLNQFLREWFEAYEEYSVGDFVTQAVVSEEFDIISEHNLPESATGTNSKGYRIHCTAWLAPFDLGVSQKLAIETRPTEMADVYDIRVVLHRESGDISNWKRVNRRFLNTLRKQFLIWRTLKQAERERYLQQETELQPAANVAANLRPQPAE